MRRVAPRAALTLALTISLGLGMAPTASSQPRPAGSAKPAAGAPPKKKPGAAASASASAAPAPPPPPLDTSPVPDVVMPAPSIVRKQVPPPPAPTPEQLAALAELEKEADTYEKAARDYRRTITGIIQHHYEDRRRRVLSALDNEIAIEKKGLRDAREEAIRRLSAFVAKYSGPNAHPENTPDAMFRLAALYEERARNDTDSSEDLAVGLKPAIALYKRVIKEFPQYRELAGIYYYLGHAYNDSSRLGEAQQVWRSLVCHNVYAYPTAPDAKDPEKDSVVKLPQDHDKDYWTGWESRHPTPIGGGGMGGKHATRPRAPARAAKKKAAVGGNTSLDDETVFRNPYPDTCKVIPQKTAAGAEPRYIAEVWWLIGDYHFNEVDQAGGPFNYNRAEAAYQQSIKFKKPPVHGVSMYKLAWTYFKQQRYETSVRQFVDLLRYTDEIEKATGEPGADFRAEAYTYIAGSLTYLDFTGPGADEPYVPRNDILDVETDPHVAEIKMRIAIERVQDPKLIPQNEKWTVDIYKALAQEFRELHQDRNNIEVDELILKKWPMHRDAPVVQNEIADIYDRLTQQSREGTAERKENEAKALAARTKLSAYVGVTPWTDANKNDPEAIQTADRLVHGGLRRAAADHTNMGSNLVQQAIQMGDKESRDPLLERALTEYKLAAQGWDGYLKQDVNASDAYESRYWLADANHNVVVVLVMLDRSPSAAEVEAARRTAVDVRDSNEDDKFLQPAAFMVVDTAQQVLNDQYKLHDRSHGAQGIEKRDAVRTTGEGDATRVVKERVPPAVLAAVAARDEYILRVPAAADVTTKVKDTGDPIEVKNAELYRFQGADYFFVYGQFDEARKRLTPIYEEQCGKTRWGYKAWRRLTDMANLENNVEESRKLAEATRAKPCWTTKADEVEGKGISDRTIAGGYYIDAYKAFQKAEKMPDGPDRVKQWREAAALYQVALKNAPSRDEAPEAAMNGALAYKKVGDYDQAIDMYTLFIKEYGSEERLKKLQNGDPSVTPPRPADPKKYGERVDFLKQAYDALSAAYVLFFNYRSAAETFDTISKNPRFQKPARREAALNAVVLYANVGDRDKVLASRSTFYSLDPPPEKKAEIDYLVASAEMKGWDEHGLDEGGNHGERLKAMAAMDAYYSANKLKNEAAGFVVMAAYNSAKLRKAGKDSRAAEWCKNTIGAFEKYRSTAKIVEGRNTALASLQADMAAECAYGAIDERIHAEFDYETGHHRYAGVIDKVKKAFDDDIKKAEGYFNQLQEVISKFESRPWSVAAKARQGSLYDSCRTGLYNARPPGLKLYTEKEEKLLKLAETSQRDDLQEQADAIRQKRREDWRAARERSLNDADKAMVKFYTEAVVFGRAFKVRNAAVDTAIQRLAFFTNILGDVKLREFSQGVTDPETKSPFQYSDSLFLRTRPGMAPPLKSDDLPAPLPVVP